MKGLLINADDFGMSENVSSAIISLGKKGLLRNTSILTNFDAFEVSIKDLKNTEICAGLHFNVLDGIPISKRTLHTNLVGDNGRFLRSPYILYKNILIKKIREKDIEVEYRAQIEKLLEKDINITHINGHQHIHAFPIINRLTIKLAKEYHIPCVRIPCEYFPEYAYSHKRKYMASIINMYGNNLRMMTIAADIKFCDYFSGISYVGRINKEIFNNIVNKLPDGVTELMCHPINNFSNEIYQKYNISWITNHHWKEEFDTIDSITKEYLEEEMGIQIMDYNKIIGSRC